MSFIKLNSSPAGTVAKQGEGNGVAWFLGLAAVAGLIYWFGVRPELKKQEEEKKKAEGK